MGIAMNYGDCNCDYCQSGAQEQYANGAWNAGQTGDLARKSLASGHRQVAGENDEIFYRKKNVYSSSEGGVAADGRSQTLGNWNGGRTLRGGYDSTQGGRSCGPAYGRHYGRPQWGGYF